MRRARSPALVAAGLCLAAAAARADSRAVEPADSPIAVAEPAGLYAGPQKGYTPPTLTGAAVVDAATVAALIAGPGRPVLIDVAARDRKPDNFPAGRLWLPVHPSIPGATWLPDAGAVPLAPEREAAFQARVAELTGGDRTRAVVVFCRVECWGSWNAGKRLVAAGYTGVRWFPEGIDGWQDFHETANLRPDPVWAAVGTAER